MKHTFECSDVPGEYRCPKCDAWAHYERDERRYCVHPADQDEVARLYESWDEVPLSVHAGIVTGTLGDLGYGTVVH